MRPTAPPPAGVDHSWKIFGVLMLVIPLVLMIVYCGWRALPRRVALPDAWTPATPVPAVVATPPLAPPPRLPVADNPLRWQDLTLMLRAGYTDDEVIAASKDRQLVCVIGPAEAAALRGSGAGGRLLDHLRARPLYAAPPTAPRVVVDAPIAAASAEGTAVAAPVDYAARDRQVQNLQRQIDAINDEIRQARAHPNPYRLRNQGYNDEGYVQGNESWLKKYLDRLDQQRNDLRRQKWRLEGR